MDDYSTSSVTSTVSNSSSIQESVSDQLELVRKTLDLKKDLARIRLERQQAQSQRDHELKHAKANLKYLQARFHKHLKHAATMSTYRRILNEDNNTTTRYVVEVQAKLLRNFHWTEIYRNQWELASNHLIDMTRFFMYNQKMLKEDTRNALERLMEISGNQSMPVNFDCFEESKEEEERPRRQQHRSRSLDMLQQTFTSTIQQAKDKWSAVSMVRTTTTSQPTSFHHENQQHQLCATVAF